LRSTQWFLLRSVSIEIYGRSKVHSGIFTALLALKSSVEGVEAFQTFPAVCCRFVGCLHGTESNFWLQTSLWVGKMPLKKHSI
jgi:hypothetical protein